MANVAAIDAVDVDAHELRGGRVLGRRPHRLAERACTYEQRQPDHDRHRDADDHQVLRT